MFMKSKEIHNTYRQQPTIYKQEKLTDKIKQEPPLVDLGFVVVSSINNVKMKPSNSKIT